MLTIQQQISATSFRLGWFFHNEFSWDRTLQPEGRDMRVKRHNFLDDYRHLCQITIELTTGERIAKQPGDWFTDDDEISYITDDEQTRFLNPAHIVSYSVKEPTEAQLDMVWRAAQEQGLHNQPVPA